MNPIRPDDAGDTAREHTRSGRVRPEPSESTRRDVLRLLRWPITMLSLATLAFVLVLGVVQRGCRALEQTQDMAPQVVRAAGEAAAGIAERFRTGTITETFVSSIPHFLPAGGSKLELVSFEAVETFTRTDSRSLFWGALDLGRTTTEIRVPVVFRYHLSLNEPWHLAATDRTCIVHAPRIRPSLPPAIRTEGLERRSERGWARFNADQQMTELERTLTIKLSRRAANVEHIALVREQCRVEVARFVRTWLLQEDHWRDDRFTSVIVLFADEPQTVDEPQRPTLTLEPAG